MPSIAIVPQGNVAAQQPQGRGEKPLFNIVLLHPSISIPTNFYIESFLSNSLDIITCDVFLALYGDVLQESFG